MVHIDIESPKMAREMLCAAQSKLAVDTNNIAYVRLAQKMIDQLDTHRPLGADGKHGNLHTKTCGCDEVIQQQHNRAVFWSAFFGCFTLSVFITSVLLNVWWGLIPGLAGGVAYEYFFKKMTKER